MPFSSSVNAKPRAILPSDLSQLIAQSLGALPKDRSDSDSSGIEEGDSLNGQSPGEGDVVHAQTAAAYRRSLLRMLEQTDTKVSCNS